MTPKTITFECSSLSGDKASVTLRYPTNEEIEDYRIDTSFAMKAVERPKDWEDDEQFKAYLKAENRARKDLRLAWFGFLLTKPEGAEEFPDDISGTAKLDIVKALENSFTVNVKNL